MNFFVVGYVLMSIIGMFFMAWMELKEDPHPDGFDYFLVVVGGFFWWVILFTLAATVVGAIVIKMVKLVSGH